MTNGSPCAFPGCSGTVDGGYCTLCGRAPVATAAAAPAAAAASTPAPAGASAKPSSSPRPVASLPTPSLPAPPDGAPCSHAGCNGRMQTGYCNVCGRAPSAAASTQQRRDTRPTTPVRMPKLHPTSLRSTASQRRRDSARTSSRRTSGRRLGLGLVDLSPVETGDPAEAVMDVAEVPEEKRYCSSCGKPVGRSRNQRSGRTEGFCPHCRARYSFTPKLVPGDVLGGQYEVLGALAHGGLGWIYLARDRAVHDRWVVLKGLLDTASEDAALAAVAEKRFLAALDHPRVVQIYNFVTHEGAGYIVMEYVGGKSLKTVLKERRDANQGRMDPLPVDEAIAYVLGVLPAMGYFHDKGLVYCDMKPDNVVLSGDLLKLIDLGGVRRIDDEESAIYGTVGYQAPEVAQTGPRVESDLYTVGRMLAVLTMDFRGYQDEHVDQLPPPDEQALLAERESFHRFLLKATAPDPAARFSSAEEMSEQLLGILREEAARRGDPQPGVSSVFGPDGIAAAGGRYDETGDWRLLPRPKVDPSDVGAGFLVGLADDEPEAQIAALTGAMYDKTLPESTEVLLRLARAYLESGRPEAATTTLDSLDDQHDWRLWWYRGLVALAVGDAAAAVDWLDPVYTELSGEVAPKLALARAHELAGELERSAELYDLANRTDPSHVVGAFGLGRVRLLLGDREGAVAALERVPRSSSAHAAAKMAMIRALTRPTKAGLALSPDLLSRASALLEQLDLGPQRRAELSLELYEAGLMLLVVDGRSAAPDRAQTRVLGRRLVEDELRMGMEGAYRLLARNAATRSERIALVDTANRVRPRTWV